MLVRWILPVVLQCVCNTRVPIESFLYFLKLRKHVSIGWWAMHDGNIWLQHTGSWKVKQVMQYYISIVSSNYKMSQGSFYCNIKRVYITHFMDWITPLSQMLGIVLLLTTYLGLCILESNINGLDRNHFRFFYLHHIYSKLSWEFLFMAIHL